jgi:hypothetical protein
MGIWSRTLPIVIASDSAAIHLGHIMKEGGLAKAPLCASLRVPCRLAPRNDDRESN